MRIPIEPLRVIETTSPSEQPVQQTEAMLAARRISSNLPRFSPDAPRAKKPPAHPDDPGEEDVVAEVVPEYDGEERRQTERRAEAKPALLDTRRRRERRRQPVGTEIDLEV
jgi:hypothetical protein